MFEFLSIILEPILEIIFIPIFWPEFDLESSPKFNWLRLLLTLAVSLFLAGAGVWLLLHLLTDSPDSMVALFGGLLLLASGGVPAGRAVIDFIDYRRTMRRQRLAKTEAEKPYQEL
ncbi:hypothetical protein FD51_GL003021 [Lacticaseibacillus zeae DSM 20178 = KCTC 3804]|uniref:Uncharacterized protein n=2 Tax=Lacticaseibacillus zeae TaxID=57037 RepID=A0A5R8LQK3_LACZE|nr:MULTISPECIES: hypothetical protein [Lacticaseibacillus]KLI76786.1 hypothetical protein AAW28_01840 [Lacticaseibacillus casei]KRK12262.1 hypothetical protein FD51_GL003021 [Lacticaseibacillus zeae DSM 20178 = KCTC 3804]OLS09588.1 hypothetical protein AUQ39_05880 [Lacticaseibacillus casei]QVI31103.1 hypothetical protein KG087_09185 [Lacticaseibacillus zeae]TLF39507.1 hypothetical protein FEI14_12520 [Lacticaseibacillus zeae]